MTKYCELIKKEIDKKAFKRNDIIDNLDIAKKEWNYPQIKLLESQEKLVHSDIQQMTTILNTLLLQCPQDNAYFDIICEDKCKWYYEFLKEKGKI